MQNYFLVTEVDKWALETALKEIEDDNPRYTKPELLQKIKSNIKKVADKGNGNRAEEAKKILRDWKVNKKI